MPYEQIVNTARPIVGFVVGVGFVVAVFYPFWRDWWQNHHGEQRKRSLPKQIDITYYTLRALVAAPNQKNNSLSLDYDQLFSKIVKTCNDYTSGGDFDPELRKNKKLWSHSDRKLKNHADHSISILKKPESQILGPLIEQIEDAYKVTRLGRRIFFEDLPSEPSERPQALDEILKGLNPQHSTKSSLVTDKRPRG